jgi:hypothetical protein
MVMAAVWFFINRLLWKDRGAKLKRTGGGSTAWWLVTFGIHQLLFGLAVAFIGIPMTWTKGIQYTIGVPEFYAKYKANDELIFVNQERGENERAADAD